MRNWGGTGADAHRLKCADFTKIEDVKHDNPFEHFLKQREDIFAEDERIGGIKADTERCIGEIV